MVENPGGGAAFDHSPAVQHERFVGELAHHRQVVADQEVGDVGLVAGRAGAGRWWTGPAGTGRARRR